MIAEMSAWASLLAAVISIVLEIWRARRFSPDSASLPIELAKTSIADRNRVTRGVSARSVLPVIALSLSAVALNAYRTTLGVRADLLQNPIADSGAVMIATDEEALIRASEFEATSEVVATLVIICIVVGSFLLLRIIVAYGTRVVEALVAVVSAAKSRRAEDARFREPSDEAL